MIFINYTEVEKIIFRVIRKYFEVLPSMSDYYKNGFHDIIAQFSRGGKPDIIKREKYERITQCQILIEIENLSVSKREALKELHEKDFLHKYYDERSEEYIYDDDNLSRAVTERFKCWVDDNFNLLDMLNGDSEDDENVENLKIIKENLKTVILAILKNATSQQLNAHSIALLSKSLLAIERLPKFIAWKYPLHIYIKNETPNRRVYRKLTFSGDGIEVGTEYSINGDGRWELIFEFLEGMSRNDIDSKSSKKIIDWSRLAVADVSKESQNVDIDYFGEPIGWDIFDERIEEEDEEDENERHGNGDDEEEKHEADDEDEENEGEAPNMYILKNYKDEDIYVSTNSLGKFNLQLPQDLSITITQISATLKTPVLVYFSNDRELYTRPIMARSCFVLWVIEKQGKKSLEKLEFYPSFEETFSVTKGWNLIYHKGPRNENIDAEIRYMLEYQAKLKKLREEKS